MTCKELDKIKKELAALKRQVQHQVKEPKYLKIAKLLAYADFKYFNNYSNPDEHWKKIQNDKLTVQRYHRMADAVLDFIEDEQ